MEGYVQRKNPGNPQRPLTAYVPGHEDEQALREQELLRNLQDVAERLGGEISYRRVMEELKMAGYSGRPKVHLAHRIAQELQRRGAKVWR